MTELEKKDEILKLLTKALIIAIDDDVSMLIMVVLNLLLILKATL